MQPDWKPPDSWRVVTTIEAHAAGEPLRVLTGGVGDIPGKTMLAKRRYAQHHLDDLRTGLMWEPRGHADMYGAIVTDPVTADGDLGILFLHNEGFSTMCGHGVIALTKVVLDTGMVQKEGDHPVLKLDTPAGRVTATGHRIGGMVNKVSFLNVPAFVYRYDCRLDVPGIGPLCCDIAFGGAFYAFCDAGFLDSKLTAADHDRLIEAGRLIKQAVMEEFQIRHPSEEDLGFLYGTIFTAPAHDPEHHSRNVCIFADGELDRSPTGTGVSARAAIHYGRGELKPGQAVTIESILGTCFEVRVVDTVKIGPYKGVVPEVSGSAHIVGQHRFYFDPEDPLRDGFIFR